MNSSKNFINEVAIITGAGQGIGFEIATQLSLQGAAVVLNDYDDALAVKAADAINKAGGKCIPVSGDAGNIKVIENTITTAVKNFGAVTLVIANAGHSLYGDFFSYSKEDFDKVTSLNMGGTFFLAQSAAKQMMAQKTGGSMLFISSVVGHQAIKDLAAYAMTKAAIEMLAKNLVIELSKYNITINTIAPGATATERTLTFNNYINAWSAITPLGKPAMVQDIANAALFFLAPASRHITGQNLIVDGGWTCYSPLPPDK